MSVVSFMRGGLIVCIAIGALMLAGPAAASPPSITAITIRGRAPTVTFDAPKASSVNLFIASSADRASDGSFIAQDVVVRAVLPRSALQSGTWTYSARLDPGNYFLLLKATADQAACGSVTPGGDPDPSCADGFSPVAPFTVPMPRIRYEVYAKPYYNGRIVRLGLLAEDLGVPQAYRVCYRLRSKARRCVASRLDAYHWDESSSDVVAVDGRPLARSTTFTWFVEGAKIASRTTRTR